MRFYSQTLEDIPKEFLSHQKSMDENIKSAGMPKSEDLLFILAVLLFLRDEPLFDA